MNPPYNQHPYYNYQQQAPGPPQPPWQQQQQPPPPPPSSNRQSIVGWNDPRLQQQQGLPQSPAATAQYGHQPFGYHAGPPTNLPPHPPPPPSNFPQYQPPYNQDGAYRPHTPQYDTSGWGVRYNQAPGQQPYPPQHQQQQQPHQLQLPYQEQKPALPPRPGSTQPPGSQGPSASTDAWQHQQQQQQQQLSLPPQAQFHGQPPPSSQHPIQQYAVWDRMDGQQQHSATPPTPPPRPAAYSVSPQPLYNNSNYPHPEYSHQPPTHHYEPHNQAPQQYYGHPAHNVPHPEHSQQPSSHHYDPPAPSSWPPGEAPYVDPQSPTHSQGSNVPTRKPLPQQTDAPVSPMENDNRRYSIASHAIPDQPSRPATSLSLHEAKQSRVATSIPETTEPQVSATALGHGQPSDWQHYGLDDAYDSDSEHHSSKQTPPTESHSQHMYTSPEPIHADLSQALSHGEQTSAHMIPSNQKQELPAHEIMSIPLHRTGSQHETAAYSRPAMPQTQSSSSSVISGFGRAGTIDSVIKAWNAPRMGDASAQTVSLPSTRPISRAEERTEIGKPVETIAAHTQTDFPPIVQVETKIETRIETKEIEVDPYSDLKNEYGATLKRFAGMLRQEAAAEGDEEKFKIFQGFIIRELRLRSVLYGVEVQQHEKQKDTHDESKHPESKSNIGVSPARGTSHGPTPVQAVQPLARAQTPPKPPPLVTNNSSPTSRDDSYIVINADDHDAEYSPGGRPRITPLRSKTPKTEGIRPLVTTNDRSFTPIPKNEPASPSLNAPMTLDDYVMPDRPSPSHDLPMVVGSDEIPSPITRSPLTSATLVGPIDFHPPRPVYTPFRYGENQDHQIPAVVVAGPPSESYSALRQTQAAESGRMLAHDSPPIEFDQSISRGHAKSPSGGRREHEEAFIGLIRQQSKMIRRKTPDRSESPMALRAGTPGARHTPSPAPNIAPLTRSVGSLRSIVPKSFRSQVSVKSPPPKLVPVSTGLAQIPDEFSFIHATVLSWDKSNRQHRQKLDSERSARASHNEAHIDQLFNDDEIGYADIADLEADFKLEEANKKYEEDQEELASFTLGVFDTVVGRIEKELGELQQLHTIVVDLLELGCTSTGRIVQATAENRQDIHEKIPTALVMDFMLQIFHKIEIRHQKIAEARFERERRRKRLESSILYTNGDMTAVKKLEKDFAKAEIVQILEEARKKDERANKLMDSFDQAVVRGLAENQGWIDDVLAKVQLVRGLVVELAEHGPPEAEREQLLYGEGGVRDLMNETHAALDYVSNDSKDLIKMSNTTDKLLNEADFALYVAEAKLAEADVKKFEQLKVDKKKEDDKILEDFEGRMRGITKAPEDIVLSMKEIRDQIGEDKEHRTRIEGALERAKRRNTLGASGPPAEN